MANDQTIEQRRTGGTDWFCVYEFDIYPRHSVLAGQTRKRFIEGFETLGEAQLAYPKADVGYRDAHNSVSHLPGEDDPVPGGMFHDDEWR